MCGIAGMIRHPGLIADDVGAVARMTEAQVHRGPCGSGSHSDGRVALGHRRLSIIDVSEAGAQPMANEDGSLWVTYNGEIFNYQDLREQLLTSGHRFRSRTDTEVLLHGYEEWGIEGLLDRLRGMFAFGLYDARRGLFLVRDRFGIKPLYYHADARLRLLLFASEVKALVRSGYISTDRDREAVIGFLLTGSVPSPHTIVKGVSSLQPGHYLLCEGGEIAIRKYWDLPYGSPVQELDFERMRALLQDSVTRQLVSDVPIGVFLGGGLDSGAIVELASRALASHDHRLTTLTVTFDEEEFSEARQAREVAKRFHTNHHDVRVTRDDFLDELPAIFSAMDQPTNDGVNTYFVSKAARQAGLTVVLSGLGGDEVFWGYKHYRWLVGHAGRVGQWPSSARRAFAWGAGAWGQIRGKENWMRLGFLDSGSTWQLYLAMRGFFPPQHVMRLLDIDRSTLDLALERHFDDLVSTPAGETSAAAFNRLEFKRYLHDQLLRDTDVFSMAHSIEVRVPFLDRPIVEYAASVRSELKIANGVNKPLLAGALDDPLLASAAAAKKQGFSFPMKRWMTDAADQLEETALSANLLNPTAVGAMWKEFRAGRLHWSRAWALSVLGASTYSSLP